MKKFTSETTFAATWYPQQAPAFRHGATRAITFCSSVPEGRGLMVMAGNYFGHIPKQPRGFAVFTAIVLIGLTGIAIAALAALFTTDVHRTQNADATAQICQLLLAAIHMPPPPIGQPRIISLPPELIAQHATLTTQTLNNDGQTMTVQTVAQLGKHKAVEMLNYKKVSNQWILTAAHLQQ